MKKYDVIALGELFIDFTESGMSPAGNPLLEVNPGGAPCNVLAMLSKLGKKTTFIGKVGNDIFGKLLTKKITEAGVGTDGLKTDSRANTTLAFVHTFENGDREFSFYRNPGADMMLEENDVDPDLISKAKIFHFGTLSMTHPGCREATKKAVLLARQSGCIVSFDPNLREPLWDNQDNAKNQAEFGFRNCDILKISDNEVPFYTGHKDYDQGIRFLQENYQIPFILLTLGADGSCAYIKDKKVFVPAFRQKTIETTGAGDTFDACVLNYVLEHGFRDYTDSELREMLLFANATASIVTTRKGALLSMPEKSEIDALIAAH